MSWHYIDALVITDEMWHFTGVYGDPRRELRNKVWQEIRVLDQKMKIPWVLIGDFNACLHFHEKKGGISLTCS